MSPAIISVPCPPAFLDPLTQIEQCYYYAVPKFFGLNHPNTRWLITMIRNNEGDRLKHKMEISPGAFKGVYYQMMDCPQLYMPEDVAASPMFKRQAVVYLSPLGMAMYLANIAMTELFLTYKDTYDEVLCDPLEPQYATHLQDNEAGDFHSFPPYVIMLRRNFFSCAQNLLKAGWDPSQPVAMPMRRKFERRVIYYRDWLDVSLSVLTTRPMFPLQVLIREITKGSDYAPLKMPLQQLLPPNPAEAPPIGLINVDELPPGVQMIGVRSLLDMAEHYDRYLQMRQCARDVAVLKKEASAVGLNPEVLMIQAQDFDGGAIPAEQTDNSNVELGVNNSSVAELPDDLAKRHVMLNVNTSAKQKEDLDPQYASEGCRILHFALNRDPHGKSMQVCMEAFCVLLRRGFYLQSTKPEPGSSLARDARNTAALMLNLIQREQGKVDRIVEKIKSGVKKFAHLEEHKQLENRKTACILYMNKLVGVLTTLLLHTKGLVDFIRSDFPPFSPNNSNFPLNPYLAQKFEDIKFGIIQEFNSRKEAWMFLDKEMLQIVAGIPQMQLRFKVGKTPTVPPKKGKNKNKSNMSNTNSCFVTYTRVQRKPKKSATGAVPTAASSAATDAGTYSENVSLAASLEYGADQADSGARAASPEDRGTCGDATSLSDVPDLSDMVAASEDVAGLMRSAAGEGDGMRVEPPLAPPPRTSSQRRQQQQAAAATAATAADAAPAAAGTETSAPPPDIEKLLANLCREVDSLFQPLETGGSGGGGGKAWKSSTAVRQL
ncbi:hypothetical protein BOX15_Mlig011744g2 [Macrostomum lignano]|uniref:Uncharacterized protein n=1 Tax=Macrostomum lignano TaxID=282301 RepID=A0A267GVS4_9PLAT|nr:hypothetical protein BOX15_Mlig011744g2 [Macrostomum lignano]